LVGKECGGVVPARWVFRKAGCCFARDFEGMAVAPVEFGAAGSFDYLLPWKRHGISEDFLYDQGMENADSHFPLLPL
jgi:hypothetical protein